MPSFRELNETWADAVRSHSVAELPGEKGPYRPIGDRTLKFMEALWQSRRAQLPDLGAMIEAGCTVRLWADPHLGHAKIMEFCNRTEFKTVGEMDEVIMANVRQAMAESDLVVCLGDLAIKDGIAVQRRLNHEFGSRHLLLVGNHDRRGASCDAWSAAGALASLAFSLPTLLLKTWIEQDRPDMGGLIDWERLPTRVNFGLCHWPIPPDRLPGPGWLSLHGHIHDRKSGPLRVNCSVEAIGYRPQTLRSLVVAEVIDDLVRHQDGLDVAGLDNYRTQPQR